MRLPLLAAGLAIALVARIATAQTPAPAAPAPSPAPAPAPSPPPAGTAAPPQPAWTIPPEPAPTAAPAPAPSAAPAPAPAPPQAAPAPEAEPVFVPGASAGTNWRRNYHRAPDAPASSWEVAGLLGLEIEVRGAFMLPDNSGSPVLAPQLYSNKLATGNTLLGIDSPYSYDPFGVEITAGYRLLPYLSVGGFFGYANYSDNGNETDSTSQLQRQAWQLGAYVRFYGVNDSDKHGGFPYFPVPVFSRLQPWVELGVGYTEDTSSYVLGQVPASGGGGPVTQDMYNTYQGVVTNLRIGLDWRLAPIFSVGPVLGYGRAFGFSACADSEPQTDPNNPSLPIGLNPANTCSSGYKGPQAQTNDYGVISAGIFLKVTLGPDVR